MFTLVFKKCLELIQTFYIMVKSNVEFMSGIFNMIWVLSHYKFNSFHVAQSPGVTIHILSIWKKSTKISCNVCNKCFKRCETFYLWLQSTGQFISGTFRMICALNGTYLDIFFFSFSWYTNLAWFWKNHQDVHFGVQKVLGTYSNLLHNG